MDRESHKASKEYLWMVRAVIESLARTYNFKGYLQCDGFAGYETAFRVNPDVSLVNCMAHIRRKYEQALDENRKLAEHALGEIQYLYQIEHECDRKGTSDEERRLMRQQLARPIMESMALWLEQTAVTYSPQSLTAKAAAYACTRWDNMMRYLEDGRLMLDNNLAENEIRPVTLGRKNYLFCGNHEAAENMCVILSLLATCRNHGVNPRKYLNDIIAKMPYMEKATDEQLAELLPHRWKLKHEDALMQQLI